MQAQVTQQALKDVLTEVRPAIPNKPSWQALAYILLEGDPDTGRLLVAGGGEDVAARAIPARNVEAGYVVVPFGYLYDYTAIAYDDDVYLCEAADEEGRQVLEFHQYTSRARFVAYDAENAPIDMWRAAARVQYEPVAVVDSDALARAMYIHKNILKFSGHQTSGAAHTLKITMAEGNLRLVSADGYLLAESNIPYERTAATPFSLDIALEANVSMLSKLYQKAGLKKSEAVVIFYAHDAETEQHYLRFVPLSREWVHGNTISAGILQEGFTAEIMGPDVGFVDPDRLGGILPDMEALDCVARVDAAEFFAALKIIKGRFKKLPSTKHERGTVNSDELKAARQFRVDIEAPWKSYGAAHVVHDAFSLEGIKTRYEAGEYRKLLNTWRDPVAIEGAFNWPISQLSAAGKIMTLPKKYRPEWLVIGQAEGVPFWQFGPTTIYNFSACLA